MLIRLRRTALSKTPHALADGLMLVFQHPVNDRSPGLISAITQWLYSTDQQHPVLKISSRKADIPPKPEPNSKSEARNSKQIQMFKRD